MYLERGCREIFARALCRWVRARRMRRWVERGVGFMSEDEEEDEEEGEEVGEGGLGVCMSRRKRLILGIGLNGVWPHSL